MIIYSDVHLGLARKAGTTPRSSLLWQHAIYKAATAVTEMDGYKVCLGDLFDRFSNPERIVMQGMNIVSETGFCLAGNHDVTASADGIGSLQLLRDAVFDDKCIALNKFGETRVFNTSPASSMNVAAIPHCTTQELFEQSLLAAASEAAPGSALLLHCNYDMPESRLTPTTLNLTRERAEMLLDVFDQLFIGHEHTFRTDFDGRLVIPGSVFPTGFDNMSNKYVISIEGHDPMDWEQTMVWDARTGYVEGGAKDLLGGDQQFVRLYGEFKPSDIAGIWKSYPNLLALKWDQAAGYEMEMDSASLEDWDLISTVEATIEDAEEQALWKQAKQELDL